MAVRSETEIPCIRAEPGIFCGGIWLPAAEGEEEWEGKDEKGKKYMLSLQYAEACTSQTDPI